MRHRRIAWLCGACLAASTLLLPTVSVAQQPDTSPIRDAAVRDGQVRQAKKIDSPGAADVQEGFQAMTGQTFSQSFPRGKFSVVERQIVGSASLLTTAHEYALRGEKGRADYREAVVYQAASRLALDDERFVEALYLTFHARSLGRGVIRANTTRLPEEYQPDNLELIKRAGGVDASEIDGYLKQADEDVPSLELLFVE